MVSKQKVQVQEVVETRR